MYNPQGYIKDTHKFLLCPSPSTLKYFGFTARAHIGANQENFRIS